MAHTLGGRAGRRAGGRAASPPACRHVHNIPFVLASFGSLVRSSFGSLVLSYVTTASGGAASPGLGGQRTPRGKVKYKARIRYIYIYI